MAERKASWCRRKEETWPPGTQRTSLPSRKWCRSSTASRQTYASSVAPTTIAASGQRGLLFGVGREWVDLAVRERGGPGGRVLHACKG